LDFIAGASCFRIALDFAAGCLRSARFRIALDT
jgi:hypothetical protein